MKPESNIRILAFLRLYINLISLTLVVMGLIVIFGWSLNIPLLKSFQLDLPAMRFNTALSLLLLGSALWLLKNEETSLIKKRLGWTLAGLILLLSLLTVSEYIFGWNLGIDELFFKDLDSPAYLYPGRIGPLAALCIAFSSMCLLGLSTRISRYFSYGVTILSLLIILNNLFDFQLLFRRPQYISIPTYTGVVFLILSFAMLAARPSHGLMEVLTSNRSGSRAMRLLLPMLIGLTILMALLIEQGARTGILNSDKETLLLAALLIPLYVPLIYLIAKDINRAEEKLLLSDQILARVNALVLVADANGFISYVSPAVKTILGFEPSELLGDGWGKISRSNQIDGTTEKEHMRSDITQSEAISAEPYEREIKDRWGKTHWIMWMDALGPESSVIGVGHDITERKHAEYELMENELRYRQAIMAAHAIPYSLDYSTNQYIFIGNGIAELTGFSVEEFTPALLDSLIVESIMQGNFQGTSKDQAVELIRQGTSGVLWQCDHCIRTRSGEERWFSDASIQILDSAGIPTGSVGIFQDISNRKRTEQALRQSEEKYRALSAELEQRVLERTADLKRVNLELERAGHAKDEFLAVMSHELRTPLNSILGLSEILLEQTRGTLNDYQQKSILVIETSGQHLLELIKDILDLSKIVAGKLELNPEAVNILELCEASLAFVKEQALKKSIILEFQPQQAENSIMGDPRSLKQILVNLLTNAVKFTHPNGHVILEVHADPEKRLMQFSVSDNGIGITPENISRLFQPFVQVDSKLNRQYGGTGLGLALIQKLVDLHGGSVALESELGKGSCFTVNLPWQPEIAEEKTKLFASEQVVASDLTVRPSMTRGLVLLAEDNAANILAIGEYLESKSYQVIVAGNGVEAVTQASQTNPNIILMDIQMPVMDGLEAIRQLRADTRFHSVPIIALTALTMPGDRERCLAAGASEYLTKPVGLKELVNIIDGFMGSSEE